MTGASSSAKGSYIEIVGNGTSGLAQSNARTLDWSGNEWLAGTLSMKNGSYKGTLSVTTLSADMTYTLPNKTGTIALTSDIPTIPSLSKTDSGDGNVVTGISVSNHAITVTKGDTFVNLSSSQTITGEKTFDDYLYLTYPNRIVFKNGDDRQYIFSSSRDSDVTGLRITAFASPSTTSSLFFGSDGILTIPQLMVTDAPIPVSSGGTGASSFTANSLIISGSTSTSALTTRSITNNTSNTAASASTNIPTMNTLFYTLAQINNANQTHATSVYAPTSAGTANSILYSGGTNTAPSWTTGHYIDNTHLAINSTSAPTENLYVNGTLRLAIGNSDTAADKRVIIGSSGKRYLSFGGSGIQAYNGSNAVSKFYVNYNGGTFDIGASGASCNTTLYGKLTATEYAKVIINDTDGVQVRDGTNTTNYIHGYVGTTGSTSTTGLAYLTVGNTAEGRSSQTRVAGNAEGRIYLYSAATKAHIIRGASVTTDRSHYFPNSTGWIATGGNGTSTGAGAARRPVYLSTSGVLTQGTVTLGTDTLASGGIIYASADDVIDVAPFKYIPYDGTHYHSGGQFVPTEEGTACLGDEDCGWRALYLDVENKNPQSGGQFSSIYMGMSNAVTFQGVNSKIATVTVVASAYPVSNNTQYPSFQILIPKGGSYSASTSFCPYDGWTTSGVISADYAEYCKSTVSEPGRCVKMSDNETFILSTSRLERGCEIVSDTFGMSIGKTEEYDTPIAASGRVLAYPYEDRELFRSHIGWPVCSGPNGTVSLMTEEEEEKYPSRIIGTVWGVPDYESWGTNGRAPVNGRVWIRVR